MTRKARVPLDPQGKPLDPTATYVALVGFASGYTVVSLASRLGGDNATVARFSANFIREDEPANVIAASRAARRGELNATHRPAPVS